MAKLKPQELKKNLKPGGLSSVYLFYGDDQRGIDKAVSAVETAVFGEEGADGFSSDFFHGKDSDISEIVGAAQTLTMMGGQRMVVVKHVDEVKGTDRQKLIDYIQSPNPDTVLVLSSSSLAVRGAGTKKEDKNLVEASSKSGHSVLYPRPTSRNLPDVVREIAGEKGKKIEGDAVRMLIDLAGDEMLGLEHEMDKIALYVEDRKTITREDVLEAVASIKEANIFEFTDAIGTRNTEAAIKSFRRMREQGHEPLMILGMLLRHFRLIWKIKQRLGEGQTPGVIAKAIRMNEWILKNNYLPQVKKFSEEDAGRITRQLADLDANVKGTRTDLDILFERTVLKLCLGRLSA